MISNQCQCSLSLWCAYVRSWTVVLCVDESSKVFIRLGSFPVCTSFVPHDHIQPHFTDVEIHLFIHSFIQKMCTVSESWKPLIQVTQSCILPDSLQHGCACLVLSFWEAVGEQGRACVHGRAQACRVEEERGSSSSQCLSLLCLCGRGCRLAFPLAAVWRRGRAGVSWHWAGLGCGSASCGWSLGDE